MMLYSAATHQPNIGNIVRKSASTFQNIWRSLSYVHSIFCSIRYLINNCNSVTATVSNILRKCALVWVNLLDFNIRFFFVEISLLSTKWLLLTAKDVLEADNEQKSGPRELAFRQIKTATIQTKLNIRIFWNIWFAFFLIH